MSDQEKPKAAGKPIGAPGTPPAKPTGAPGTPPAKPNGVPGTPPAKDGTTPLLKQKWFAPAVVAGLVLLAFGVMQLGKSNDAKAAAPPPPDPKTTGELVVKSNRANATFEATRTPAAAGAAAASFTLTPGRPQTGLPPGRYAVIGRAEGWPDRRETVDIVVETKTEIAMNFPTGSLRLDSDPTGATVRRGEAVLGKTPLVIPELPVGECQLSLEYPSWPAFAYQATIAENREVTATARLPHGKLTVETTPEATVLLDGKAVGRTPLTLDPVPTGPKKLTVQAKDFPTLNVAVNVTDGAEAKTSLQLGAYFPLLDPAALLHAVWVPDNPDHMVAPFDGLSGPSAPRNGIIKNLNRKRLYEGWLRKKFHYAATVKSYDAAKGVVEFEEQKSDWSRYRVVANFSPEAMADKDLPALVAKGATLDLYGRLSAVEEPHWPFKVITLEIAAAEALR